ncbi:MAG: pseudouridine-5'-phosphate glycosidase [Planctomycetaceae bacterium]
MTHLLRVAPTVAAALAGGRPVVALETTLVTHGLPHPDGLAVAAELERVVAARGATPATIGILDGALVVGLSADELARLAATPGVEKANPGNLAAVLAAGAAGSTTVAATLLAADRAGIRVMATGGIGGVHRGAEVTGDVSADLVALARHPVAVVCAGAKAVLDLARTREFLETLGVPVLGAGTTEFPAFYRRSSGLPVDRPCADAGEIAAIVRAHLALATTGVVIANPVPAEHELAAEACAVAIDRALAAADAAGVRGRDVTPFLLDRMRSLTAGASVAVNRALLVANAALAADVATALARSPRSA